MDKVVKEKWLEALRSGEYKQGTTFLHKDDSFCCLGVLCDLHSKETGTEWSGPVHHDIFFRNYLGVSGYLPKEVRLWANINDNCPVVEYRDKLRSLINLNDTEKLSFLEIADFIEESSL